jgi:hypothetical protein
MTSPVANLYYRLEFYAREMHVYADAGLILIAFSMTVEALWEMAAVRTIGGVVISVIGLILLLYAGVNFNNLFFVQKLLTKADIPVYDRSAVAPAFLGLLILLDGSFVLGLKRVFSLSLHVLGNFVWLVALYQLDQNLVVPIADVSAYQQVFFLVFVGVVFFIVGIIVNDIPKRGK